MKLKKIIASVLALATVSSVSAMSISAAETVGYSSPTEPGTYLIGDANHDGQVRANDLLAIRRSLLHLDTSLEGDRCADANQDGQLRSNDLISIRRVLLHLDGDLGSFTIYADDVLGGDELLPALDELANTDFATEVIAEDDVKEIALNIISILDEYSKMTDEQKAEIDSKELAERLNEIANAFAEALLAIDETTAPTLAETVANIIKVYEELGINKNVLISQVTALLNDNGITIDANLQATLLSIFAQAKAIYDANGGVITAEQLLAIINSLKATA
ncbi:MAG: dockerin type I domain-containing protein [Oscillospiraceae bacterium]